MIAVAATSRIRSIRACLLALVAANLLMIGTRVASYPPVLDQPRGALFVLEPTALLIVYAWLVSWATRGVTADGETALLIGSTCGIVSGVISISHIVQENYLEMSPASTRLVTWTFIIGMFLPWAVAGFRTARKTGGLRFGLCAAVWSAVVCMVLTLSFGFAQLLTSLAWLEHRDATSPDFLRSGWSDLRAFAIADIFDAGFWHLLLGPTVAAVLGAAASVLAYGTRR
jgi:hypothetical protein